MRSVKPGIVPGLLAGLLIGILIAGPNVYVWGAAQSVLTVLCSTLVGGLAGFLLVGLSLAKVATNPQDRLPAESDYQPWEVDSASDVVHSPYGEASAD